MKNILILDDNKYILDVLYAGLSEHLKGCTIKTALDSDAASDVLRSGPIDLILTDLDIPVHKGYAFIEHAKNNYPSVPVCVMTGACPPSVITKLKALGVKQYIQKPFQFDKLASVIAEELHLTYPAVPRTESGQA